MNTDTAAPAVPNVARRSAGRASLVLTIIAGYLGLTATGAMAQTDSTGGLFTTLQGELTGTIIPAAAALIVVALVFGMAVKWVQKASKKS